MSVTRYPEVTGKASCSVSPKKATKQTDSRKPVGEIECPLFLFDEVRIDHPLAEWEGQQPRTQTCPDRGVSL